MSKSAFRIATVTIVLIFSIVALNAARSGSSQSSAPDTGDAKSLITYFVADGSRQTGYRSSDRELAIWALEAWQRSAGKGFRLAPAPEPNALIRLYWAEPNNGEYGEMRPIIVGDRRGAALFIRPDMDSLGPEIAQRARVDVLLRDSIVYLTCLHELGHALGLSHTRDSRDIMYYFGYGGDIFAYFHRYRVQLRSRNDIAVVSGLSDADVTRIKGMFP